MTREEWRQKSTPHIIDKSASAEWQTAPAKEPSPKAEPPPEDNIGTGAIWRALRSQYRTVLAAGLVLPLITGAAIAMVRMSFSSTGRLYLGELDSNDKAHAPSGSFDFVAAGASDVASEIEIIKSQSIVHDAIAKTSLNATVAPADWSAPRFGEWLLRNRDSKLLIGAERDLIVRAAALRDGLLKAKEYDVRFVSETEFEVYENDQPLGHGLIGQPFNSPNASFTLGEGVEGGTRKNRSFSITIASMEETYENVLKNLTVGATKLSATSGEMAKVVTFEFADKSPQRSADFLRNLMGTYLDKRQSWKTADASAAESFVSGQLGEVRQTLDKTQQRLADYRTNTKLMVMDNEAKAMIEQMGKYEEQRVAARLQVSSLADIKRVLKDPNPQAEAFLVGDSSDTVLEGLARSLADSRKLLVELQGRFSSEAPDVRNMTAQVNAQLGTIRNYVSNKLNRAQENLGALNHVMQGYEEKLRSVPGAELHLAQLARESDVYTRLYSYLLERQQQAALLKASTVSKNRILDTPKAAVRESSPRAVLIPLSSVLGLILGAVFVVFRHFSSGVVQSGVGLRAMTGEAKRIGSIPHATPPRRLPSNARAAVAKDVLVNYPSTSFVDAFRTLREDLYQTGFSHGGHVVLVTSPCPGDGKTTTVLSLAALLAAGKRQVLVVDANLRDPSHHEVAGYPMGPGLGDVLSGQASWREVIHPVSGPFGEFYSIQAGGAVPVDLLSGDQMARFLLDVRNRFEFVLIDSPSFPVAPDALGLARLSDGVVSVARIGHTPRELLAEHMSRMANAARRHLYLLNDTPDTHGELRARAFRSATKA
jgi:tyrosine-protein kinase Etk/Wzc